MDNHEQQSKLKETKYPFSLIREQNEYKNNIMCGKFRVSCRVTLQITQMVTRKKIVESFLPDKKKEDSW